MQNVSITCVRPVCDFITVDYASLTMFMLLCAGSCSTLTTGIFFQIFGELLSRIGMWGCPLG